MSKKYKTTPELLLFENISGIDETFYLNEIKVRLNKGKAINDKLKSVLKNSEEAAKVFYTISNKGHLRLAETFIVVFLNTSNIPIGYYILSIGTVKSCIVDIPRIIAIATKTNATALMICHNHPSGNTMPSKADTDLTKKINNAAELLSITLLDHIIISPKDAKPYYTYYSFADNNALNGWQPSKSKRKKNNDFKINSMGNIEQITMQNYFDIVKSKSFYDKFQKDISDTFIIYDEVIREATDNGKDLQSYKNDFDSEMKEQLDLFFNKLNKVNTEVPGPKATKAPKAPKVPKVPKAPKAPKAHKAKYKIGQKLYWYDNDGITLIAEKITEIKTNEKAENIYVVSHKGQKWEYLEKAISEQVKNKDMFIDTKPPKFVANVHPIIRIIKRFISMNEKTYAKAKLYSFLKNIHRQIQLKQVRKADDNSELIMEIQKYLVNCINSENEKISIKIENEKLIELHTIVGSEAECSSIKLLKRFLNLYTNPNKEKAAKLKHDIEKAEKTGKLKFDADIIIAAIDGFLSNGKLYVNEFELSGLKSLAGLNGLNGLDLPYAAKVKLSAMNKKNNLMPKKNSKSFKPPNSMIVRKGGFSKRTTPQNTYQQSNYYNPSSSSGGGNPSYDNEYNEYDEYDEHNEYNEEPEKINSMDVKEMEFDTIGFNGKWLKLIGDPVEPWSMMIYGNPGSGKSTLAIELAYYIAASFNKKVGYVSKEEGAGATLQEKFARKNAFHPNIDIFPDKLPDNPEDYDYIFLDSVTELGVTPGDFRALIDSYGETNSSFVGIFKGTKGGSFRGSLDFEHSVDVSVSCEKGEAKTEKSRFGGNGSVTIYDKE